MSINIAIDGPAGAGKSTIAKELAKELGFVYVDTGAMYRAMALYFMKQNIKADHEEAITIACKQVNISIQYVNGAQQVILNNENVTGDIRREEVGNMASATSVYPVVREKLVSLQQELAQKENVIMDGRDIGTCVLPHAQVKIYLTASVHTRASRRYMELQEKGLPCDMTSIEADITERDYRDMNRKTSPLKQAEDAMLLDTSEMNIAEVVTAIRNIYQEKTK